MRHHLVPLYNFDPGECEDWEAELLEEADQNSQKKIQVNLETFLIFLLYLNWEISIYWQDYKSMSSPSATSEH